MTTKRTQIEWTFDDPQVELRLRPLREHWEARGPGMLRYLCKQLPWVEMPESVRVHLVTPQAASSAIVPGAGGSGGRLIEGYIEFHAVLANPFSALPEVVRLAWLQLCLAVDEKTSAKQLIPVTIMAAEYVELAKLDIETTDLALNHWMGQQAGQGGPLLDWWHEHRDTASLSYEAWQSLPSSL